MPELAQIARSIAFDLGLKNTVVCETAALAHDIGNPPFGHYGETILNDLAKDIGGYEGNAQALRILRTLEKKHHAHPGLNLNIRTLMAVTKYFNNKSQNQKKFLYDDDYQFMLTELKKHNLNITKSIDAKIMDLADEIAYAAHDLEDAMSFGMIGLGEILHEFKISKDYNSAYTKMSEIAQEAQKTAIESSRMDTSEEYSIVLRKELTSIIVNTLCRDIGLVNGELNYQAHADLAGGLKKLLFKAILRKISLFMKSMGRKLLKGFFRYTLTMNLIKIICCFPLSSDL